MEDPTDLRNTRARLVRLALAALIGGVLTFFAMKAMLSSGRGPNPDPIGQGSAVLVAIAMFTLTTTFSHRLLSRRR